MMSNYRLRERGPMERLLSAGIARAIPAGAALFLILDFLAVPTWMALTIIGSLLSVGYLYLHLLAQVRIADAVSKKNPEPSASHENCDSESGAS